MKIFKLKIKYSFLFLLILSFIILKYKICLKKKKKLLILVDISGCKSSRGPSIFNKGIKDILPYNANKCSFISSKGIYPSISNNKVDYFYFTCPSFKEKTYNEWVKISKANKLILGPNFVPQKWFSFPNKKNWKEKRFKEIIETIKGIAVHTYRAKIHLAKKSNTLNKLKKYKIIRQCSNLKPKFIKNFKERTIDILFFEKYIDLNHKEQGKQLYNLLKKTKKKIKRLKYGYYNKKEMEKLSNNSKFIIYFSFFDIGPIGLIEIQNHGVILFTHQKEFVVQKTSSFFVPELADKYDMKSAFNIIMKKIEIIIKSNPNSELIAKNNQEYYKCQNSLEELCKNLE